jgi:hypothetical protein
MKTKFKEFYTNEHYSEHGMVRVNASTALDNWLAETPGIEIISWQAVNVGIHRDLHIIVQYKET